MDNVSHGVWISGMKGILYVVTVTPALLWLSVLYTRLRLHYATCCGKTYQGQSSMGQAHSLSALFC
jgi:hypothetical protein